MRATLLVFALAASCSTASSVEFRTTSAGNDDTTVEATPRSDARLMIALGDRISQLDLSAPTENQREALLPFAAPKDGAAPERGVISIPANETAQIHVRSRRWTGEDVASTFIGPLGGAGAVDALNASAPDFAQREILLLTVDVTVGAATHTLTKQLVIPADETALVSSSYATNGSAPLGAPLRLWSATASKKGSGSTPALNLSGTTLSALGRPLEELPTSAWTLWMQLMPSAPGA